MSEVNSEYKNKTIDRMYNRLSNIATDAKLGRNRLFNIAIILLNIAVLIIASFLVANKFGYLHWQEIWSAINYQYLALAICLWILLTILRIIPIVVHIKKKSGMSVFSTVFVSELISNYYHGVSIYNSFGFAGSVIGIEQRCQDKELVLDTKYSQKWFGVIAQVFVLMCLLIINAIFTIDNTFTWLIVGIVVVLLLVAKLIVNIAFVRNSEKIINQVASFCRILYKIKLIKDVDKLYNKIVDRLIMNSRALKQGGAFASLSILTKIVELLIYGLINFLVLLVLNNGGVIELIQMIYCGTLLYIICEMAPTPNGTLIFELLFVLMFASLYVSQYVALAMIIIRVLWYFIDIVISGILMLFSGMISNKKNKINP